MQSSFYFYANPYQPRSEEAARALAESLKKSGAMVYSLPWLAEKGVGMAADENSLPPGLRAVIALGGDGTLLRCAPLAVKRNLPLFGVHTGTVGFLMPGDANDPEGIACMLMQPEYPLIERPLLEIVWENQRFLALNDVSLTRGEHPGVIETTLMADNEKLFTAHGDGAVISTPQGATAYMMAAGGPIVHPDTRCLLAAPISARELLLRPVVLPAEAKITMLARGDERRRLQLAIDGQHLFPIRKEISVSVRTAKEKARLIYPGAPSFFNTLRQKQKIWNHEEQE